MVSEYYSRLAIAAILLSFQVIFFAFEFNVTRLETFFKKLPKSDWLGKIQYYFPFCFGIFGIIVTPYMLARKIRNAGGQDTKINSDIGGPGIRFSIWAQEIVLIVISIVGTFHTEATGVKEIGAGLAITHISLAIALLVEVTKKNIKEGPVRQLEAADAILGSIILDSQNIALSIPLVTKETLASRWQVIAMVCCQCFGLTLMAVIVQFFSTNEFCPKAPGTNFKVNAVWWGLLSGCGDDGSSSEMRVFWVYYACRWLMLLQSSLHALMNMSKFHAAEKYDESLTNITFPALVKVSWYEKVVNWMRWRSSRSTDYGLCPTTVSLVYIVYGVFALASLAAAEKAMKTFGPQGLDEFSVGQVIAVVVASVTIARGIWLFSMMLRKKDGGVVPRSVGLAQR